MVSLWGQRISPFFTIFQELHKERMVVKYCGPLYLAPTSVNRHNIQSTTCKQPPVPARCIILRLGYTELTRWFRACGFQDTAESSTIGFFRFPHASACFSNPSSLLFYDSRGCARDFPTIYRKSQKWLKGSVNESFHPKPPHFINMAALNKVLAPYVKLVLLDNLTPADLSMVLRTALRGICTEVELALFLTALTVKGLSTQADYIAAAVNTVLEFVNTIAVDEVDPDGYIDIVGTGGDGQNTFNVSTSLAIVAAGMGLPVCKHGGKALTSKSGSGDLLKCLGVDLMNVTNKTTPEIVKKTNFCFLFAPAFHPVMGKVANVRAQMSIPTIFNVLGPLINPMPLRARILGVYSHQLGDAYAKAASQLNKSQKCHFRTMVVHGDIGLDEISPIGTTHYWMVDRDGLITEGSLLPADFGLPEHSLDTVRLGTPEENADVLYHILRQDNDEYRVKDSGNHPIVDYILLNSAALAYVCGKTETWAEGVELAKELIRSHAALKSLEDFKAAVQDLE